MAKLLFGVLMIVVWWMLHALQTDEELALLTLHGAKRAVDRAAHAAAQMADRELLELGVPAVDRAAAEQAVLQYLRENLRLDGDLLPLPGSPLRDPVEIRALAVVNGPEFPYRYVNEAYNFEATLERPGVVVIVHVEYPRLYGVLGPVAWDLKGVAELVY